MAAKMLDLKKVMSAADNKNYDFYDNLPADEKKLFSPYLSLRWMASVSGGKDLQAYYVLAVNEQLNKHFWDVSKHPKLAWLAMAAAAPGVGSQFHYWVAPKKGGGKGKLRAEIARRFPTMKEDEIDLFMTINTEQDIAEWLTQHGMDPKEVKALLK